MHIIIVGGGTAGWLTAAVALALKPEHTYTVIESTRVGIIGVGESTTGFFTDLFTNDLRELNMDHDDFMIRTGATCKLGIRHRGWRPDPDHSYFGPLDGSHTQFSVPDSLFEYSLHHLPPEDIITISHTGYLIRHGLSNMGSDRRFTRHGHSMHVDGTLTGQYFRDHCVSQPQCTHLDREVLAVELSESGSIAGLKLDDGLVFKGDLYIDCTGFARLLIGAVGAEWISYKSWLPVDRGMPFLENYQLDETPEAWTTAWAQQNGWMWTTPLLDRKGNGYVFSSDHCTAEQAQAEIETRLGRPIIPVKLIKFDAGRQDRAWIKNCVSIGLSSSFLEPLEATSIHTTIVQIKMLFQEYLGETIDQTLNPAVIKTYNHRWANQMDDLKDFLVMHYQGGRTDSEFWRYISSGATQTDRVKDLLEMSKDRIPSYNDFPRYWGVAGWSLYCWIMAGLGKFNGLNQKTDPDWHMDNGLLYQQLQGQMQAMYGNNLSHNEYIRLFRLHRKMFKQEGTY